MTVFAHWIPVYTVTYNGNGNTGGNVPGDGNTYVNGYTVTVLGQGTLTRPNYSFAGWNTQADTLGANYLNGNTFSMGSVDVTLYAKWRMNPPTITTQPTSTTCPVNDSVTFAVGATGASLGYQWQKNNANINGANSASYTPTALAIADTVGSATYRCIVSNLGGSATCNGATLAVSTLTDADGNVYHQVKIGTQVWSMENLKTTKYRDGTAITKDTSTANWGTAFSGDSGKYCWYGNDSATNKNPYGALYNWYTVKPSNPKAIAPLGWHVPTDAEWTTMSTYLGGDSVAGDKMKESGTAHWSSPNMGTNSSGFSALPGGCRTYDGEFLLQRYIGYWWSATEENASVGRERHLRWDTGWLFKHNDFDKITGFSVRLVRD
jgi:uncharacterized protein (TIGR02145 family)/uncharacterized repeat protein (TIGR02543 family)